MGRSRVLSFISTFGGPKNNDSVKDSQKSTVTPAQTPPRWQTPSPETPSPPAELSPVSGSGPRGDAFGSRPASTVFSRNPPLMQQEEDTPPELSPIFSFLNIHTNKVYHEGYFLKLSDLDSHGRPSADRQWLECYAQLVGTVLSLWDAAALDAAGGEEVPPTFINLTDASIKMIETLPIRNGAVPPLKNVLSLSSAGKNRYLLHFNSFHSLAQWTAAIRLTMYEHTSLYEAYTGSLIAAKGKHLPGIQSILVPTRFKHEDWARVRFGAGTPWRRCWFVITPPDEKEIQKARKSMKKSAYDRLTMPVTGHIKFYETKKTKKAQPIATVTNVYSAYAIYPQSKALIDQSTLVKLEGRIHIHTQPQSSSEGYVFVMPEVHPAVSGFETMLRFLFPTFDTFNLYGRPTRLVADTNHIKSIMFAFPKQRRYGYLDVLDIAALLQTPGSQEWTEADWRRQLKEATQRRISAGRSRTNSVNSSRPRYRSSISIRNGETPTSTPPRRQFPTPAGKSEFNQSTEAIVREVPRNDQAQAVYHSRGLSDTTGLQSGHRHGQESMFDRSPHSSAQDLTQREKLQAAVAPIAERSSSESDRAPYEDAQTGLYEDRLPPRTPPSPVASPPAFSHGPREKPTNRPEPTAEQRLAHNRMSHGTLSQLAAVGTMGMNGAAVARHDQQSHPNNYHNPHDRDFGNADAHYPSSSHNAPPAYSSNETVGLALPVQPPQNTKHRPNTPNSSGTPSPQQLQIDTSRSVRRKPLPQRDLFNGPVSPGGEPSMDDLRHTLDEEVLNRIAPHLPSPVSPTRNEDESVYDDASTISPDYASTHGSIYSKKSVKSTTRPRMGVMKTVGEGPSKQDVVIGDAHYSTDKPATSNPDIPTVDFGPTLTYMPTTGRPNTSGPSRKPVNPRNDSEAERLKLSVPLHAMDRDHSRSPSQDEFRRSMLWQPGMTAGRPTTPGGLTPEQFVQQRAAPSPQMHVHHRTSSNHTPPPQRPASGDWTQQVRPGTQMTNHRDPNYRPSSRGTNAMMGYNDVSTHLSAREQEHVARMTGSSFFNMSSNDNRKPEAQMNPRGLVSAIDARERERREMREGMSNQMVQHAIAQRQQRMQQQQLAPPYAGSMYAPPQSQDPMYSIPGASHTWDALHQMNRPDEPRRRSWYGQLAQAPPNPPSYQQSQHYSQHPGGYYNNANITHY